MFMQNQPTSERTDDLPEAVSDAGLAESAAAQPDGSRREFLLKSARRIGYAAPIVLLFKPRQACASGGSQITHA